MIRTTQKMLESAFGKWNERKFYKVPAQHTGLSPLDPEDYAYRTPEERAADDAEMWAEERHLDRVRGLE